jgi:hypothetical protein
MRYSLLAAFALIVVAPPTSAADLDKIDHPLRKEPAYQTKSPKYCLVVFGPKAETCIWLVLDGEALYVDKNGNGDLTEPGESTGPADTNTDPCSFKPIKILHPDGKTEEELSFALYGWFDYKAGKRTDRVQPSVSVGWNGRWFGSWGDETGPCVWGKRPADAPILHVDGPLQMGFEVPADAALERKGDDKFELKVGVGTKGLGRGSFVHLSYAKDAIPKDVYPTADLEFPAKDRDGPPVRVRAVLKQRC